MTIIWPHPGRNPGGHVEIFTILVQLLWSSLLYTHFLFSMSRSREEDYKGNNEF